MIKMTVRMQDTLIWTGHVVVVPDDEDPIMLPDEHDDLHAYTLHTRCWVIDPTTGAQMVEFEAVER